MLKTTEVERLALREKAERLRRYGERTQSAGAELDYGDDVPDLLEDIETLLQENKRLQAALDALSPQNSPSTT